MHSFDTHGWLSDVQISGRTTDVAPPAHGTKTVGLPYPNFTGVDWVMVPYSEPVQTTIPMDQLKTQKITSIRTHFGGLVAGLKADAAPYEVETWAVQTAEYSAWAANNTVPTPYVSALAAARGMTLADLMAKIGAKVAGLASIQGMQHALEAAVNAATTQAELDAVVF